MHFEVRQPRYNAETENAMREAQRIMDGSLKAKSYGTVDEMFADLDAEE